MTKATSMFGVWIARVSCLSSRSEERKAFERILLDGFKITFTDGVYNLHPAAGKTYRGVLLFDRFVRPIVRLLGPL
jgi:hypothetical protein